MVQCRIGTLYYRRVCRLSSLQHAKLYSNHVHDHRRRTTQICIPIRTQNVRFDVSRKMITVNVETIAYFYIFYFARALVPNPTHESQNIQHVRVLYIIIYYYYSYYVSTCSFRLCALL